MTEIIPVISDLQVPFHDEAAVAAVATFVAHYGYDTVSVGDVLDQYQVSKWCRGMAGEFDGKLAGQRDTAVAILSDLRVKHLSRSNHDTRIEAYLRKHAPGLDGLPELRVESFLRLDTIGCTFHREPFDVAPGWLLGHGDEGSLVRSAGGTALALAKRTGRSFVCGHSHRMGIQHDHSSFRGKLITPLWGFEVGHLMRMELAEYLKGGIANWQPAFGVLVVDGQDVTPIPVPIRDDGSFYFDGKRWRG
jgi:hypothetical protein